MKRLLIFLSIALSAFAVSAETRLTFDQALRLALRVNNQVEAAQQEINVAEENRSYLLSQVLPHIQATGNLQRNSLQQTVDFGDRSVAILPQNNWNYQVTLQQPIFAGLREQRAYSQAKIGIQNAQQNSQLTQDQVLLRVASSFLALVNAGARIDVEQKNIELAQNRLKQSQAFFNAGEVTKVDVLRAETAVKAAQRQLAAAQQGRATAESDLRAALDINDAITAVPPAQALPAVPADESVLVSDAIAKRPDVTVASNNVRIAGLEVQKQRGFWLPTVSFNGGFLNQKSPFPANSYAFGALQFTVPIFSSGEVQARVASAKAQEEEAKLRLDTARTTAREDVRKALVDLHASETSLGLARDQLAAAQAEYTQTFELYRAQEATSLDLASAEASLADARRAVAEESLNRDLAQLRVWYAAGDIKQAVGVTNQ